MVLNGTNGTRRDGKSIYMRSEAGSKRSRATKGKGKEGHSYDSLEE